MHIYTRNVNTALPTLIQEIQAGQKGFAGSPPIYRRDSRNGYTLEIAEPTTITYSHPLERVLFNQTRDANPFFHLYEALWMLAGRNDVEPLEYYNQKMGDFSDDGETLNGAYGYRWRHYKRDSGGYPIRDSALRVDQLDIIVNHLKADPNSRRAVLNMWNIESDLLKIGEPCNCKQSKALPTSLCSLCNGTGMVNQSLDCCCNLEVMFLIRDVPPVHDGSTPNISDGGDTKVLDMTVTNRSNDMIWGALGANYCHFTMLQEYMTARIGVEVGKYHHISNCLHVYDWNWKPEEWLADVTPHHYQDHSVGYLPTNMAADMWGRELKTIPLVKDPAVFERELQSIVGNGYGPGIIGTVGMSNYFEPFLQQVAKPMICAHALYREKEYTSALAWASRIQADDWKIAARNWLTKRVK